MLCDLVRKAIIIDIMVTHPQNFLSKYSETRSSEVFKKRRAPKMQMKSHCDYSLDSKDEREIREPTIGPHCF